MNHEVGFGAPTWTMYTLLLLVPFAALLAPSTSFLLFPQVEFDNECLRAMCIVDSGCRPKGCSDDANGRVGCGYFRLNMYQYKQCYQPGKRIEDDSEAAWLRCAEDYECSSQCIKHR
uniref:lysozyme n=1 Tax=Steinernema glaseri TaxID=37863 RepID=A0A1I7Y9J8_9BILA